MATLLELLGFPDRDGIRQIILDELLTPQLPITSWQSGDTVRTIFEIDAATVLDLTEAIIEIVFRSFLGTADEKGADGDWLTMLAHNWYGFDRFPADTAQQTISLVCAAGFGPYNITPANIEYLASDGTRYFAVTGGSLSSGSPLTNIDAIAESPGAARGLITELATKLPGVTVSGAAIKVTGLPLYGRDEERDASLLRRCNDRWPTFDAALVQVDDRVVKWIKASTAEITRTRIDADPANAGGVIITVAGSAGAVSAGAITVASAAVQTRQAITDYITIQNSVGVSVLPTGTVIAPVQLLAQVMAAADASWMAYLAAAQIGGAVEISELIQAVMDAGAITFTGYTLVGVNGNFQLAANQVAVPNTGGLAAALIWNGV